ncbi:MAG: hypothetical protein JOZ96_17155 [Acidobacteria bacterium]|nr:hypothetical protein [Acidobacteriota bacterium]
MTPEGLTTSAETATPVNPFPGLRAFEFDESHLYFGRDGQSGQLIRKLAATRFVAVVGTSGSGKSSLVRAGLLPDLYGGYMASAGSHWRVALLRPGNDPLGNLARALSAEDVFGSDIEENARIQAAITEATLRRGGLGLVESVAQQRMPSNENLLVVVDQFEELFRFARVSGSEQYRYEAAAFVKLLLEAARQRGHAVYVVITMRSDFLGDCSQFWDLPEAINEGQYLIPRMTRDQREEAIAGPVAVCGGRIEPRLVNRLLNDVGDNPDQLPILQHALMRTWESWKDDHAEGEALDLRHYESIGTMAGALSLHADEAFEELSGERRRLAEKFFKALTEKGEDNREVRRPTVLGDLCVLSGASLEEAAAVLEVFRREGRSFLTPPADVALAADSLIDISHESLIRNWKRLKEWVDAESQSAQIYTRLAQTAVLYERGQAGLWRDPDLQLALDWREQTRPTAAWGQRYHPAFDSAMRFLDESVAARDAALLAEEQKRRREVKRARVTAVVFFLLFMLSLVASAFAYNKSIQAQAALDEAQRANAQAQTERARAVAERDRANEQSDNAQRNEQKAKEAEDEALKKQKEAEASKAEAEKQAGIAQQNFHQAEVARLEADKQRKSAEAAATRNRQLLYVSDINLVQRAYLDSNFARGRELLAAHSPLSGDAPGFEWFYLWHVFNGETDTFASGKAVEDMALSRDGSTLVIDRVNDCELWDVNTRRMLGSMKMGIPVFAISPDGKRFAFQEPETHNLKIVDAVSHGEPVTLKERAEGITSLAFSPDGRTLAAGDEQHKVEVWDLVARDKRAVFEHTSFVRSVAFSPDGGTLATSEINGTLRLWDVKTNKQLCSLSGQEKVFRYPTFSPDGKNLFASVMQDGSIRQLEVTSCKEQFTFDGTGSYVSSFALSPDGRTLVANYGVNDITVWDVSSRRKSAVLKAHEDNITAVTFSGDGRTFLTGSQDGTVKVWDVAAHVREQSLLEGGGGGIESILFSPDGKRITTASHDAVGSWDAETHQALGTHTLKHDGAIYSTVLSPDGRLVATVGDSPPVKLWDAVAGKELATLAGSEGTVLTVAFSPDSRWLVTGGKDATVRLWNVASASPVKERRLTRYVINVAFSPDGKRIAAITGKELKVWDDTLSRELVSRPDEEADGITSVAFSPDSRILAVGTGRGFVRLLDAVTGKEFDTLSGHKGGVYRLAFSPDGRTLATGGEDMTVKLWRVGTSTELITINSQFEIRSLAFSPDSRTLATGLGSVVKLWRAASDEEVRAGRR